MARLIFRFRKNVSADEWNTIEKALSHKYLRKIPTGNPKNPWYYIYKETFLKPFKALKDLFGLSEKRVSDDYERGGIKKDYGADKQTFAAHVLEFFTNKDKWNALFRNKADRDKNKKPVTQKQVEQAYKGRAAAAGEKAKEPKRVINRSLMRKVWEIYSPEAKQILQAEKDAETTDNPTLGKDLQEATEAYTKKLISREDMLKKDLAKIARFANANTSNTEGYATLAEYVAQLSKWNAELESAGNTERHDMKAAGAAYAKIANKETARKILEDYRECLFEADENGILHERDTSKISEALKGNQNAKGNRGGDGGNQDREHPDRRGHCRMTAHRVHHA